MGGGCHRFGKTLLLGFLLECILAPLFFFFVFPPVSKDEIVVCLLPSLLIPVCLIVPLCSAYWFSLLVRQDEDP